MPFTIRSYRRFPVPCSVTSNSDPFLKLPLTYLLGFWLLITLLVLSSGPVHAEWELASGDDAAGLTVYVDRDTIRRKGNLVKMWQLYDYKTVQTVAGDSLLSIQRYNEYDCTEERTRMLAYTWFSSNMGRGRVVYKTADEQQWEAIVPRSIDRALWKVACSPTSQTTGVSPVIRPDVTAAGPMNGTLLDKYDVVAVLPFADAPLAKNSGSTVADIVSIQLLGLDFTVVERARIQQLFEEQGLQLRSADEQATAIRIGRLAGAKAVVLGTVQQWETTTQNGQEMSFVSLSFRLVDIETGAILFGGQGQFRQRITAVPQVAATAIAAGIIERMAVQTGLRGTGRIGVLVDFVDRFNGKALVVSSVIAGGPAEKAGLKAGDIIVSCNGSVSATWKKRRDYWRACQAEPGQDLVQEVVRGDQRLTIRATTAYGLVTK